MLASSTDLAISGLTKSYGDSIAVDDVTLRIAAGELVALLGPSGCGKTTTLRMIAGLVEPTAGEVLIGGSRVTHVAVHKRNIGMLFQSYALFPHLTVAQNVAFGLQMRRLGRAEVKTKVDAALGMVQLEAHADKLPAALSGGQQQRVALARALVIEPTLLLLDEPLGALDKNLRESMQYELRQIQQRLGITAVLVTHDQEEALTMADRVVIMRGGRLEQVGSPREVYEAPSSRFVASFIGASNFVTGRAVSADANGTRIRLSCDAEALVNSNAEASGNLVLSIRPEFLKVRPISPGENLVVNEVIAVVERVLFRGQVTHIHMKTGSGTLLLSTHTSVTAGIQALTPGDAVVASWDVAHGRVVSDS